MKAVCILSLLLTAFTWHITQAQDIEQLLDKTGNSLIKNKEFRAVSIGIYKDGHSYTGHFGTLSEKDVLPPTDKTIYEIASVTKTFTGYLVAKAVLEGKISLDDEVQVYLEGDFSNLTFEDKSITIRDIVTHTAGLPHSMDKRMAEAYTNLNPDVPTLVAEVEENLSKDLFFNQLANFELTVKPGTQYSYSNAGAELMGYILTKIYQKSIDELLNEAFLSELGMNDTAIKLKEEQKERLAQGYWMNNSEKSPNQSNPLWATGSGLKSTMSDLMKYIEFNLNLENSIIEESHRVIYEQNTRWMGYFWNVWKDKYGTSFNHHGGTSGTQNWLYLFPKYDLGISIIVNHSGPKTPKKLNKAARAILKELDY